ncbi:unnamed protein product [Paramecium pentaurelia]|uniref:Uncharacterized protein n=1 Tax=Paramecium pentaurelia TaxID=43138 RepID=A0A8S1VIE6_9CILI|nr:unnamed protein product [Paramecium pentaurelia]
MDQNQEKKNEKKAPFIITTPKQVISSAYLHISDFEEKPRFIVDESGNKVFQKLNPPPEKSNVKAGYTELLIRKVSYQEDPYERKECLERFEQLQNKVKIPCPFKCPRNHKIKEKGDLKEKTVEYGRKVIKRNISRLLSATKSKEQTEKLNKLMIKADTLFRSRKIVTNVKQQQNVSGFDKNLFANVDKWKNVLNILEKKEQEELQKSKLSFQKQRDEQKQQYVLESTQKRKEKEFKELKDKEIKEQKEQKNKEIQEQILQKELKYKEMQEQKAQKFKKYEQVQNTSKLSENPKIDLTPKNKTSFSHHQESTKQLKPATPSSFQKQQNQQELKNQSFNSISNTQNTQEVNKQINVDKSNQIQHQIMQKQKSNVQTPKSGTSKLKYTKEEQIEVKSVKSNQQSQNKDKLKKENSIIDQPKQNKSQRSHSQRLRSEEERKSNHYSEERKVQEKDEKSRYSEERKSNRQTPKAKNQEYNQKIIMKPKNFTRAGSYKNPNIPKQDNSQKTKVRASSSGKRTQEEKPLNLNNITLPNKIVASNHMQDKINLSKETQLQTIDQQEQLINEVKIDQNYQNLNNSNEQDIIKQKDNIKDKLNEDSQIIKDVKINENNTQINKIDKLDEDPKNDIIDKLKEDLQINKDDLHINKDIKSNEDLKIIKDDKIYEDNSIIKIDNINQDPPIDKPNQNLSINKIERVNEDKSINKNDKINDDAIISKEIDKTIEFIAQPINKGLLNINDPQKNMNEKEQKMTELEKQMSIMENSIPLQSQRQKGISQFQSTNSLLIKQESNILKESLLTESFVESQFKETKGLDKQLLSSQLNEQDSINLSESQATLKSTLQQSQFQQKQQ